MEVCDFSRSFIRWRVDTQKKPALTVSQKLPMTLNNVRMPLESRLEFIDPDGIKEEFVLGASCKSEQVWVPGNIWHQPNADMCAIASKDQFIAVKQWDKCNKGVMRHPESLGVQPERQLENLHDAFDRFSIDIKMVKANELKTISEIVETLFSDKPVVSRTEYKQNGYSIMIEHPVKDVNFSERENFYQVDTGPVIFPDFAADGELIEKLQIAYMAHNCPEWAELIVCVPTKIDDANSVHHYSKSVRIEETKNSLFVIE